MHKSGLILIILVMIGVLWGEPADSDSLLQTVTPATAEAQVNLLSCPPPKEGFNRRIFTADILAEDVTFLMENIGAIVASRNNESLNRAFIEKIMSVVTAVNGCEYCSMFHTMQASAAGISQAEIDDLFELQFETNADKFELPALKYAVHFAETGRNPDHKETAAFVSFYGSETANEIMLFIRLILWGNLLGNTYDAFLSRLKGSPAQNSSIGFEALFFVSAFPLMFPASRVIKKRNNNEMRDIDQKILSGDI